MRCLKCRGVISERNIHADWEMDVAGGRCTCTSIPSPGRVWCPGGPWPGLRMYGQGLYKGLPPNHVEHQKCPTRELSATTRVVPFLTVTRAMDTEEQAAHCPQVAAVDSCLLVAVARPTRTWSPPLIRYVLFRLKLLADRRRDRDRDGGRG